MEPIFRASTVGLLALSALISAHYYRKAGPLPRTLYGAREGAAMAVLRLGWVALAASMPVLWAVQPEWLGWARVPAPATLRATLGGLLGAAHVALLVGAHRALGANFSSSLSLREGHRLIVEGPYRWVRHPIYAAALLLYLGLGLLSANAAVGAVGTAFILFIVAVRTPGEERMLLEAFGEEYRAYRDRTARLVPGVF